jgi:aryl-alcohol dehydrogenase-like predicted oxidoreductase
VDQPARNEIVGKALEGGINWFDTAEMYGRGRSEVGLSTALKALEKPDEAVKIATKWFPIMRFAGNIGKSITSRLNFLDGYTIDLFQIHNPASFSSVEAEMDAMADLVEAGKIRSIGVSNFGEPEMRRAHGALAKRGLPLASNQVRFGPMDRRIESNGVLAAAQELGVTIIAYSPLAVGVLSGKFHNGPEALAQRPWPRRMMLRRELDRSRPLVELLGRIGETRGVTAAQVALNWTINFHGETIVAIPGASKPHHAAESAGAMDFLLSGDEMTQIDSMTRVYQ